MKMNLICGKNHKHYAPNPKIWVGRECLKGGDGGACHETLRLMKKSDERKSSGERRTDPPETFNVDEMPDWKKALPWRSTSGTPWEKMGE